MTSELVIVEHIIHNMEGEGIRFWNMSERTNTRKSQVQNILHIRQ